MSFEVYRIVSRTLTDNGEAVTWSSYLPRICESIYPVIDKLAHEHMRHELQEPPLCASCYGKDANAG